MHLNAIGIEEDTNRFAFTTVVAVDNRIDQGLAQGFVRILREVDPREANNLGPFPDIQTDEIGGFVDDLRNGATDVLAIQILPDTERVGISDADDLALWYEQLRV